jgi:hypothetical protein
MRDENNGFEIGWVDLQVVLSTLNYNAIAILHNFQFAVAHALGFSVLTSRILATHLNTEISTWNHCEFVLPLLVQSPWILGTQLQTLLDSIYHSRIQITTARKRLLLSL